MKLDTGKNVTQDAATDVAGEGILELPLGLVGFPDFQKADLFFSEEELPFMRLKSPDEEGLEFLVINPVGFIPDYNLQIADGDVAFLEVKEAEDLLIYNIVTVHSNGTVTANLLGPIVFNRKTGRGKQIVISNYMDYSARHLLFAGEQE